MSCFATSLSVDATIFWRPQQCPPILPAQAEDVYPDASSVFDISSLQCQAVVLLLEDGRQHISLRGKGGDLPLIVSSGDILRPCILCVDAIWPAENLKHRLWALECLNRLLANESLPERLFPPEPRGERLRLVLKALDGSLDQASHQDIALALFGEHRVRLDWGDSGNHLRDRIRRAVKRGRALLNGRYLEFLE